MSALGRFKYRRGFTLVEILVVIVLIAVATAASMTLLRPPRASAMDEGRRLANLFERLALEARLSGRATAWRCRDGRGFQFEMRARDPTGEALWQPWDVKQSIELANGLRFESVQSDSEAHDCAERMALPVFGLATEFSFQLADQEGQRSLVFSDAFGRVTVRSNPAP